MDRVEREIHVWRDEMRARYERSRKDSEIVLAYKEVSRKKEECEGRKCRMIRSRTISRDLDEVDGLFGY